MDSAEVEKLVNEINQNIIVNLAAISSVGEFWNNQQTTMQVNVVGTLNILEAARKQENKPRVMFVGTSEEYEISDKPINEETKINANNPYGISKMT